MQRFVTLKKNRPTAAERPFDYLDLRPLEIQELVKKKAPLRISIENNDLTDVIKKVSLCMSDITPKKRELLNTDLFLSVGQMLYCPIEKVQTTSFYCTYLAPWISQSCKQLKIDESKVVPWQFDYHVIEYVNVDHLDDTYHLANNIKENTNKKKRRPPSPVQLKCCVCSLNIVYSKHALVKRKLFDRGNTFKSIDPHIENNEMSFPHQETPLYDNESVSLLPMDPICAKQIKNICDLFVILRELCGINKDVNCEYIIHSWKQLKRMARSIANDKQMNIYYDNLATKEKNRVRFTDINRKMSISLDSLHLIVPSNDSK